MKTSFILELSNVSWKHTESSISGQIVVYCTTGCIFPSVIVGVKACWCLTAVCPTGIVSINLGIYLSFLGDKTYILNCQRVAQWPQEWYECLWSAQCQRQPQLMGYVNILSFGVLHKTPTKLPNILCVCNHKLHWICMQVRKKENKPYNKYHRTPKQNDVHIFTFSI